MYVWVSVTASVVVVGTVAYGAITTVVSAVGVDFDGADGRDGSCFVAALFACVALFDAARNAGAIDFAVVVLAVAAYTTFVVAVIDIVWVA